MPRSELLNQVQQVADRATVTADGFSGVLSSVKGFILENFGQHGLIASYLVITVIILLVVSKLAKITFSTLKYLIVPALGLAFLATLFLPYSFAAVLPVSVTLCSLFLLFRG
jgi:hypothetical protein